MADKDSYIQYLDAVKAEEQSNQVLQMINESYNQLGLPPEVIQFRGGNGMSLEELGMQELPNARRGLLKAEHALQEVTFMVRHGGNDGYLVVARKGEYQVPVARFVGSKDKEMYNAGLEKNFKVLVNMESLSHSLGNVLDSLAKIGKLTEPRYLNAMSTFEPFIKAYKKYSEVVRKIDDTDEI